MPRAFALIALTVCSSDLASAGSKVAELPYAKQIRAAATAYRTWGRVDEHPNIAPTDCAPPWPMDGTPAHVRRSEAEDVPHGKKLYYLWASDRAAYLNLGRRDAAIPNGFAIVKESFAAKPLAKRPPATKPGASFGAPAPISWLEHDGKLLGTGDRKDLFVMTKVGDGAGTDDGWVYGTVAPDGTVTSAGTVERCMSCHDDAATHERLFGLKSH